MVKAMMHGANGKMGQVITGICKSLYRISDSSSARSSCQSGNSALESSNTLFKNILCGICESAVDIACILEAKAICSVLRVMEDVRCSRINGYCSCVSCGICLLLSYMEL